MPKYILSIDQGTTGTQGLLFDEKFRIVGKADCEVKCLYPQPGWVEQDAQQLWKSVVAVIQQVIAKTGCHPQDIVAIGIDNQRETTVCFDRQGHPLHNALVWQDRRTQSLCKQLQAEGHASSIQQQTGLLLDPYFSATKMHWLFHNVPSIKKQVLQGKALFGTIDSFLVYRLSGGLSFVTDVGNASRTLLFDLKTLTFAENLCRLFGIPLQSLARVVPSQGICAVTKGVPGLPDGIPVAGLMGDQQAALFGHKAWHQGSSKCTYGTGAFLLVNAGNEIPKSQHGLLSTIAWQCKSGAPATYALEGSVFVAGALVQWLRDELGIIRSSAEIETLAASVSDSAGVMFVPALTGLGAPHWQPAARGMLHGLTRGTTKAHIARAALEGVAMQVADLLEAVRQDTNLAVATMQVDGGMARNDLFLQIQADVAQCKVTRLRDEEATPLGVAMMAGQGIGLWTKKQLREHLFHQDTFAPQTRNIQQLRQKWSGLLPHS